MKIYKFGAANWKSGLPGFWVYKKFESAYQADRWATRVSFKIKGSPYMVWLIPGEEVEA